MDKTTQYILIAVGIIVLLVVIGLIIWWRRRGAAAAGTRNLASGTNSASGMGIGSAPPPLAAAAPPLAAIPAPIMAAAPVNIGGAGVGMSGGSRRGRTVPISKAPIATVVDTTVKPEKIVRAPDATAPLKDAKGTEPVLLLAETRELAEKRAKSISAEARAVYAVVVDKKGDNRTLLSAVVINLNLRLPPVMAPDPTDQSTGWLFKVTQAGDDRAFAHLDYVRPADYSI